MSMKNPEYSQIIDKGAAELGKIAFESEVDLGCCSHTSNSECSCALHDFFCSYRVDDRDSIEKLKTVIRCKPEAALRRNRYGDFPLHLACQRWYPNEIVSLIKESNLDAIREQDSNGQYPLSIACSSHGNSSLIVSMCEIFPEAASVYNAEGNAPLHMLCLTDFEDPPDTECVRVLAEAAPQVISKPDSQGDLLIFKACDWVLAAAMMALLEDNSFYSWPKDMPELSRSLTNLNTFLKLCPSKAVEALKYIMNELESRMKTSYFHLVTCMALQIIIHAHCSLVSSAQRQELMHHVFAAGNNLPSISLEAVEILFGPQWRDARRLAHERNSNTKNLPLHEALKRRNDGTELDSAIIKYLLLLNPASAACPDDEGHFPLHLCLKHKRNVNCVYHVFEAYPAALYSLPSLPTNIKDQYWSGYNAGVLAALYDAPLDVIFYMLQQQPILTNIQGTKRHRCESYSYSTNKRTRIED